jgi:hypothetical protein
LLGELRDEFVQLRFQLRRVGSKHGVERHLPVREHMEWLLQEQPRAEDRELICTHE